VAAEELAGRIGQTAGACEALGVARSTLYRWRRPVTSRPKRRPRPHRALDETEREQVVGALHSERFVDKAPAAVWATLLDEGIYYCSVRTMYRVLAEHGEVRERRNQLRHPNYRKPELLAEAPNQVWSWDITKLRGPVKWTYYSWTSSPATSRAGCWLTEKVPSSLVVSSARAVVSKTSNQASSPSTRIVAARCEASPSPCSWPISA